MLHQNLISITEKHILGKMLNKNNAIYDMRLTSDII